MNTLEAKARWNILKGWLKQNFARLANDQMQFMEGKEDELIGRIQKRSGQIREKMKRSVDGCSGCNH